MRRLSEFIVETNSLKMGEIPKLRGKNLDAHLSNPKSHRTILNHLLGNWTSDSSGKIRELAHHLSKHTVEGGKLHHLHPGSVTVYRGSQKQHDNPGGAASWTKSERVARGYGKHVQKKHITPEHSAIDLDRVAKHLGHREAYDEIIVGS